MWEGLFAPSCFCMISLSQSWGMRTVLSSIRALDVLARYLGSILSEQMCLWTKCCPVFLSFFKHYTSRNFNIMESVVNSKCTAFILRLSSLPTTQIIAVHLSIHPFECSYVIIEAATNGPTCSSGATTHQSHCLLEQFVFHYLTQGHFSMWTGYNNWSSD